MLENGAMWAAQNETTFFENSLEQLNLTRAKLRGGEWQMQHFARRQDQRFSLHPDILTFKLRDFNLF